jgi:nucleoside-diphosphate-sugar epimerase
VTDALVTGAGGFIGRALVRRLRDAGQSVVAADRASGDVTDPEFWRAQTPVATVYHLAGRSFVPDSWTQPADFLRTNVLGTELALEYCRTRGANMVMASAYIYGVPVRLPILESDQVAPNNPYALSKHLAEQLCTFANRHYGIATTILRLFNVFGPGQRREFLIPSLIEKIKAGAPLRVMDLKPKRDYVFIEDVVEAFFVAGSMNVGSDTLNIGSGVSFSVGELIEVIQKEAGTALPVLSSEKPRLNEIPDVIADITRSEEVLGWHPRFDLRAGVAEMLK